MEGPRVRLRRSDSRVRGPRGDVEVRGHEAVDRRYHHGGLVRGERPLRGSLRAARRLCPPSLQACARRRVVRTPRLVLVDARVTAPALVRLWRHNRR